MNPAPRNVFLDLCVHHQAQSDIATQVYSIPDTQSKPTHVYLYVAQLWYKVAAQARPKLEKWQLHNTQPQNNDIISLFQWADN